MEEKRNRRKAVFWSLAGITMVIMTIIWGVPAMGSLADIINNSKNGGLPDKTDLIAPVPPVITLAYDATNSAVQTISGLAEPNSTVYLVKNGESAGQIKAGADGSFELVGITLSEGNNIFSGVAIDDAGNKSSPAKDANMIYSSKGPELTLDSPVENQHVTGSPAKITVSGSTKPQTKIMVNDRIIIVNYQGKFNTMYQIHDGENLLIITATDISGNQTKKEIKVTAN